MSLHLFPDWLKGPTFVQQKCLRIRSVWEPISLVKRLDASEIRRTTWDVKKNCK